MKQSSDSDLLEALIKLLLRHFGRSEVEAALGQSRHPAGASGPKHEAGPRATNKTTTVVGALDAIRESQPEKHRLLSEFYQGLNQRRVLPEAEDIRQFAQLIGIKGLRGKSRKDLLPGLMRFLLTLPQEAASSAVRRAEQINAEQRQQGFSVLADKLLKN